jgi:hypothetical protein
MNEGMIDEWKLNIENGDSHGVSEDISDTKCLVLRIEVVILHPETRSIKL